VSSCSFNLCNLPPWVLASPHFSEDPQPVEVQGVRASNRFLFETLDGIEDAVERARRFDDWLSVRFQLHHWSEAEGELARRSKKNSYLRFLRGWGVDSSSVEGAVLKSWVDSRMGLPPLFHREPLGGPDSESYQRYAADRMRGSARTNAILSQLDLLHAFTQYELARRFPGERWRTLFRGVQSPDEQQLVERLGPREWRVRLNNLSSFTDDRERAWEFGSTVWEARVPLAKVFFWSDLFPRAVLKGEREWLVVGGEIRVRKVAA
jgi:NAD+--dinitrogen-reductase ADP-D-ribosyltransferase